MPRFFQFAGEAQHFVVGDEDAQSERGSTNGRTREKGRELFGRDAGVNR